MTRKNLPYLLLIAGVVLTVMWQITSYSVLMRYDIMDLGLPWRYFVSESINNGVLPLWNPFMHVGFPQMGDPSTWYWPSWLISLIFGYDPNIIQWEYMLHVIFGGWGVFLLAKFYGISRWSAIIVSLCFALSGFTVGHAGHLGWVIGAAYNPWLLYVTEKWLRNLNIKYGVILALLTSLFLAGSYPGLTIVSGYSLIVYVAIRLVRKDRYNRLKLVKQGLVFLPILLVLSSVVLISSFELKSWITRSNGLPLNDTQWGILSGGLTPTSLLTFIFPFASQVDPSGNFWGADVSMINFFIGISSLLFICYGIFHWTRMNKRFKLFLVLAIVFLSLALTAIFPFRLWLGRLLPFMDMFRFPALFRTYTILFLVLSTGYALDQYHPERKKPFIWIVAGMILAAVIMMLINIGEVDFSNLGYLFSEGFNKLHLSVSFQDRWFMDLLIHMIVLIALALWAILKLEKKWLVSIVVFELFMALQLCAPRIMWEVKDVQKTQQAFENLPEGFPAPDLSVAIKENNVQSCDRMNHFYNNLPIFYKKIPADGSNPYGLVDFDRSVELGVFDTVTTYPVLVAANLEGDRISEFNPIEADFEILDYNPNKIQFNSNLDQPSYLVFVQNSNPNWKCIINGEDAEIIRVNETFMAVSLEEGRSEVTFEFRPTAVIAGFYVSGISFLLVLSVLLSWHLFFRKSILQQEA